MLVQIEGGHSNGLKVFEAQPGITPQLRSNVVLPSAQYAYITAASLPDIDLAELHVLQKLGKTKHAGNETRISLAISR